MACRTSDYREVLSRGIGGTRARRTSPHDRGLFSRECHELELPSSSGHSVIGSRGTAANAVDSKSKSRIETNFVQAFAQNRMWCNANTERPATASWWVVPTRISRP